MKIVINDQHGGFSLSDKALKWLIEEKEWLCTEYTDDGMRADDDAFIVKSKKSIFSSKYRLTFPECDSMKIRSHPDVVEVIEELGPEADGEFSNLKIVEVPDDADVHIEEYDGMEWIAEDHKTWR